MKRTRKYQNILRNKNKDIGGTSTIYLVKILNKCKNYSKQREKLKPKDPSSLILEDSKNKDLNNKGEKENDNKGSVQK